MENLVLEHRGTRVFLNPILASRPGVTAADIRAVKEFHKQRIEVLEQMNGAPDSDLGALASEVERLDEAIATAWKISNVKRTVRWWDVPRCTCDATAAEASLETGVRRYDEDCPVHGHNAWYGPLASTGEPCAVGC